VAARSRWWETDYKIFGGITETDMDLQHIWYPSYGHLGHRFSSSDRQRRECLQCTVPFGP
jgi:hypothetical protein